MTNQKSGDLNREEGTMLHLQALCKPPRLACKPINMFNMWVAAGSGGSVGVVTVLFGIGVPIFYESHIDNVMSFLLGITSVCVAWLYSEFLEYRKTAVSLKTCTFSLQISWTILEDVSWSNKCSC